MKIKSEANYPDLLPSELVEIIYKKKFHSELKAELKTYKGSGVQNKPKIPQGLIKVGDMINDWGFQRGKVTKITAKHFEVNGKPYLKDHMAKSFPALKWPQLDQEQYVLDEGSLWFDKLYYKYREYLKIGAVISILAGYTDDPDDNSPYRPLWLEVHRPELGVVWK